MLKTTAATLAQAMAAKQISGPPNVTVTGVSIDSRIVKPGHLFVAFPGEKVDGHDYTTQAVANGATALLVSRTSGVTDVPDSVAVIYTDNPLAAMQKLASFERKRFAGPVVAVTGSNGKTTTKEMLRDVFSTHGPCLATEKNFNNELGLPLTLLRHQDFHKSIVVEMGMRGRGEIRDLCSVALPTTGIITNIGHSHLELLGSQEQIALAKTELLQSLPSDGNAVLYGADKWLRKLSHLAPCRVLWYGLTSDCDAFATEIYTSGFKTFFTAHVLGESCSVELPTLGEHNVLNALAALLAGAANGLAVEPMAEGLRTTSSSSGRLHPVEGRLRRTILDDCYNASPSSTTASLKVLMAMADGRPTAAVLGDMYELGDYEEPGHREVGNTAAALGVQHIIAVGPLSRFIADEAQSTGKKMVQKQMSTIVHFEDKAELLRQLDTVVPPEAVVLVKASRGMKLEDVVTALSES